MGNLSVITQLPEVLSAVWSDPSGAVLDASGNVDSETVGALAAFIVQNAAQAGADLGLGRFHRAVVSSPGRTCLLCEWSGGVLGLSVDPGKPLPALEKKLDSVLHA